MDGGESSAPPAPPAAYSLAGSTVPLLSSYAGLLAGTAVDWGLLGPAEPTRLWPRHLLNCVAVSPLIPPDSTVLDIGSGAGLPGIVLGIVRADLRVTLVEPLARRRRFLHLAVDRLDLTDRVSVIGGRAEQLAGTVSADVVTARAVAPLTTLVPWCLPLLRRAGALLAFKGRRADEELEDARDVLDRWAARARIHRCGEHALAEPACVVEVTRKAKAASLGRKGRRRGHAAAQSAGLAGAGQSLSARRDGDDPGGARLAGVPSR